MPQQRVCLFIASVALLVAHSTVAQISTPRAAASQQHASSTTLSPPLFLPAVTYGSGGALSVSVAAGDVNADGKPDLVVAHLCVILDNCEGGTVSVLVGKGDGTLQVPVNYSSGGVYAHSIAIADVNGDGHPDLVVANQCQTPDCNESGAASVLLGKGDGTFQAPVSYSGGYYAISAAIADVNNDGHPDVVVANFGQSSSNNTGAVSVMLGKGDGTFQARVGYSSIGLGTTSVAVADVNGDGHPDLVVANWCQNYGCPNGGLSVLFGNGDGTFQAAFTYSSGGYQPNSVAIADVNGDGHQDLVVANHCQISDCDSGPVSVLLGNGDGSFQAPVNYGSGGYGPNSVAIADVNGDGHPDLVVTNSCQTSACRNGGTVSVLLGNGDGSFQAPVSYSSDGINATSAAIADVNADGRPDVVMANYCVTTACENGSVGVLLNNITVCTAPPLVTLAATPSFLWPPNGKMLPVTISGTITDTGTGCTVTSAAYAVTDEYGLVQPSGSIIVGADGGYSLIVPLQASRLGPDLDGRLYTVSVSATNNAGKTGLQAYTVIVPHDQGH